MKQTTIEWLEDAFFLNAEEFNGQWTINYRDIDRIIETAKEREKQQIIDFAYEIADELAYDVYSKKVIEDIFKKTFKSE